MESTNRFELGWTGWIKTSKDYRHEKRLSAFNLAYGDEFGPSNSLITDEHFTLPPDDQLKAGDVFEVGVYRSVLENFTEADCFDLIKTQRGIFAGAQGLTVLYPIASFLFSRSVWYLSWARRRHLWIDPRNGVRLVPVMHWSESEKPSFLLAPVGHIFNQEHHRVLCFRRISTR